MYYLPATPIYDKPDEIALTLNLLPIKNKIETNNQFYNKYVSDKFRLKNGNLLKPKIQKLISFYPGANKNAFPKVKHVNVYCKMSDFQWKTYRSILKKKEDSLIILDHLMLTIISMLTLDLFLTSHFLIKN